MLTLVDLLSTYPYKLGGTLTRVHYGCGIVLAVGELVGAFVVARLQRDPAGYVAMAIMVAGFSALALTFFGTLHVLFAAELTTAAGFVLLLIRATTWGVAAELSARRRETPTSPASVGQGDQGRGADAADRSIVSGRARI